METPPRLTAAFWVSAYRARLAQADIAAFVTAKGDATAGAIFVKLNTLDGCAALFQRTPALDGRRRWDRTDEGAEPEIDAAIRRALARDPDLWVIEVEDRAGRTLLDGDGLAG